MLAGRTGTGTGGNGANLGKSGSFTTGTGAAMRGRPTAVGFAMATDADAGVSSGDGILVDSGVGVTMIVTMRGVQVGRGVGVASAASQAASDRAASTNPTMRTERAEENIWFNLSFKGAPIITAKRLIDNFLTCVSISIKIPSMIRLFRALWLGVWLGLAFYAVLTLWLGLSGLVFPYQLDYGE